jgi:hypothetical protein
MYLSDTPHRVEHISFSSSTTITKDVVE